MLHTAPNSLMFSKILPPTMPLSLKPNLNLLRPWAAFGIHLLPMDPHPRTHPPQAGHYTIPTLPLLPLFFLITLLKLVSISPLPSKLTVMLGIIFSPPKIAIIVKDL